MQPDWPADDPVLFHIRELFSVLDVRPNVDLIDSPNSPLPHYKGSLSLRLPLSLCIFMSHSPSSAQLFYTLVTLFCPSVCFSHSAFSSVSFAFPCERPEAIRHAIKTHDHDFLTCLPPHSLSFIDTHAHLFSALLPRRLRTSSVKVFGWNGRWIAPNLLLTTPCLQPPHITTALPHYCHHCHSNTKNIWVPTLSQK